MVCFHGFTDNTSEGVYIYYEKSYNGKAAYQIESHTASRPYNFAFVIRNGELYKLDEQNNKDPKDKNWDGEATQLYLKE